VRDPRLTLAEHSNSGADPGLSFHTGRGAEVVGPVAGWRAEDADNDGCGILVRYELRRSRLVSGGTQSIMARSVSSLPAPRNSSPANTERENGSPEICCLAQERETHAAHAEPPTPDLDAVRPHRRCASLLHRCCTRLCP
jgi:hypothetical protein